MNLVIKQLIIINVIVGLIACSSSSHLINQKNKNMFTVEQIKNAHSKVKSGADFPNYIKEIKALGVTNYETYVSDGHIDYHGANNYLAKVPAKYKNMEIAELPDLITFKKELSDHQQGKTDYLTFIRMCALNGVEKWAISMEAMTCTYYDKNGAQILEEQIPE